MRLLMPANEVRCRPNSDRVSYACLHEKNRYTMSFKKEFYTKTKGKLTEEYRPSFGESCRSALAPLIMSLLQTTYTR